MDNEDTQPTRRVDPIQKACNVEFHISACNSKGKHVVVQRNGVDDVLGLPIDLRSRPYGEAVIEI